MKKPKLDKSKLDVSAIFLTFMALVGDVERTALAFDLEPAVIQQLAEDEGWTDKIRRVSIMSKSSKPGAFEQAQNRALIFVQAQQLRRIIAGLLQELSKLSGVDLLGRCEITDKVGNTHISAKFLTDLTTAMEACSRMSLVALGDTVTERVERDEAADGSVSTSGIHAAIIAALSAPVLARPAEELVREASETVKQIGPPPSTTAGDPNLYRTTVDSSESLAAFPVAKPPLEV